MTSSCPNVEVTDGSVSDSDIIDDERNVRIPMAKVTKSPSAGAEPSNREPFNPKNSDSVQQPQHLNVYWRPRRASAQPTYNDHSKNCADKSFPKKYFRSKTNKDIEQRGEMDDSSGDEGGPISGRRGSLLDGFRDFINPKSRPRSCSESVGRKGEKSGKNGAKKRSPSPKIQVTEAESEKESHVDVNFYKEEARDQAKPLFVNTRLANLIAEECALSAGINNGRRRRSGPISDSSGRGRGSNDRLDELEEEEEHDDHHRPRSYSGGSNLLVLRKASRPMSVEIMGRLKSEDEPYQQYLMTQTCYDLLPHIAKVILLDNRLTVKRAFMALMENSIETAPVWDATTMRVVTLLTRTDFLEMLYQSHEMGQKNLGHNNLAWWLNKGRPAHVTAEKKSKLGPNYSRAEPVTKLMIQLNVNSKLLRAVEVFCEHRVHWIPIQEHDNYGFLYLLSLEAVLRNLCKLLRKLPMPTWMRIPVRNLKIGRWSDLEKIEPDMTLLVAVGTMIHYRLSIIPVVAPKTNRMVNILTKSDIFNQLATISSTPSDSGILKSQEDQRFAQMLETSFADSFGREETSGGDVIAPPSKYTDQSALPARVPWCRESDNLATVIEEMVEKESRTVFILNNEGDLEGELSISDVIKFVALPDTRKH